MTISKTLQGLRSWWRRFQASAELQRHKDEERIQKERQNAIVRKAKKKVTIEFDDERKLAYICIKGLPIMEIEGDKSIKDLLRAKIRQEEILIDYWRNT